MSYLLVILAVVGLAGLGWVIAPSAGPFGMPAILLTVGTAMAGAIYLINGVTVFQAFATDPFGGLFWFGWIGAQLAAPGIALGWLRTALARWTSS